MILITGGSFQGKKDYVKNLYNVKENDLVDGASCPLDAIYEAKVFDHFHEYLKRLMENGNAPQAAELAEKLFLKKSGNNTDHKRTGMRHCSDGEI